jgi:hypothetical protein
VAPPCTSFTVSFTQFGVAGTGAAITAYWDSTSTTTTTYTLVWGLVGGTTTSVSVGGSTDYRVTTTPWDSYTFDVNAKETCSSGQTYTASTGTSTEEATPQDWTVKGSVFLTTPSGVARSTTIYGAQVTISGTGTTTTSVQTGSTGAYSFSFLTSTTSVKVCAYAPGYAPSWNTGSSTQTCAQQSVTYGTTYTVNLDLELLTTLETSSSLVYANIDECYTSASGCPTNSQVSYSAISGLQSNMLTDQASTVSSSSVSGVPSSPDCVSGSTCDYVSFSGVYGAGEAYTYWQVLPVGFYSSGSGIPLSSPMQLTYYVYSSSTGGCSRVAVDLNFVSGSRLHSITNALGNSVEDQTGTPIAPSYQCTAYDQWVPVIVDLSEIPDQTIASISVGFDDGGSGPLSFQAYFSGIQLQSSAQSGALVNGNFDEGGMYGWETGGSALPTTGGSGYSGSSSALVGSQSGGSTQQTSTLTQEFQIPNTVIGGSICMWYYPYSSDPTPSQGFQRAMVVDRTNGQTYYIVGSATSTASNAEQWLSACMNVTGGSTDLRGDRVWIELDVQQAGDGYVTWAKFSEIEFTPDDLTWGETDSSPSQSYGFGGASISPVTGGDLSFNTGLFPTGNGKTYQIPFGGAAYASGTYPGYGTPSWTGGLLVGIQLVSLVRGDVGGLDILSFAVGAQGLVGYGTGTPSTCSVAYATANKVDCLFIASLSLGVGFACQSGCSGASLIASNPQNGGGAYSWNLVPVCDCSSGSGIGLGQVLDILGIAASVAGIILALPESGGTDLALLPIVGLLLSSAGVGVELSTTTSAVPSGPSCTSAVATTCPSYTWAPPSLADGPSTGSALMTASVDTTDTAAGTAYWLIGVAQAQIDEWSPNGLVPTSVGTINQVYLVNVATAESSS